ncbi:hypothetical protein F4861DRAFT_549668 [Xylaria intraflava]|nr:hypothetical protein F4861DRAFT_549668 [Xylaria intraflava]
MGRILTPFLLSLAATFASADPSCLSAVSWGDPRVDLFGVAPDGSIWHKYDTGYDWQPQKFERIPAEDATCPSVSSWEYGRFDIVWVERYSDKVIHKYYANGAWGPSWEKNENLGGDVTSVSTSSWGPGRLDIVGRTHNNSCMHKAWTGEGWFPEEDQVWEDLGGDIASKPDIVSWGPNRIDIVSLSEKGSLVHKFWDGYQWNGWEDLGGGPFIGDPRVTTWGVNSLDLWAIDEKGVLNHKFWDGVQWNGWEQMGGKFSETPQVVHWTRGKIDIVGKNSDDNKYYLKTFNGRQWKPHIEQWYDLSGPYTSEPVLITKTLETNFLYLFGIDTESIARMQIWSGYEWQPSAQETWPLGNVSDPYPDDAAASVGNEL